ncbi:helix-turn-helix domain containing protein [Cryobacterium sp. SO2]|uniref:TetR/AcrR family transcriptional regulator n=1 Tax=Cryobacterium sp. SO2 TaxID=1897060 RepID=UPI00223DCCEE|nr:TetR/AcrR family transcriptional regulator [Cryobacterium sp. SO2]WEO76831.1 helix-turn-helix domain containing protein [Cryobacterium sp. SO2]
MSIDAPARRYAKGAAKRREILDAALAVVATQGYRNSSLQEIADAVGLTKAGVLHYFTSREELMAEVVSERDAHDRDSFAGLEPDLLGLLSRTIEHNGTVPGLVQLYSRLVAEAEAPEHPAHDYVRERYDLIVNSLADSVRARQRDGSVRADLDPMVVARAATALSDGLQLQWLHDKTVDMSGIFDAALELMLGTAPRIQP